jgi:uncharacterized protein (TIGR02594 family)
MSFKAIRWVFVPAFLFSVLCMTMTGAEARSRHHHAIQHHQHHYVHHHRHHPRVARHHRHRFVHHRHGHRARANFSVPADMPARMPIARGGGGSLLAVADRFVGSRNPTGYRGPWCGAFMGMVARRSGMRLPTGYLQAREWAKAGRRISGPRIGAIAVLRHHVGIVAGIDRGGNPILVSGNHGRRVGIGVYGARRVIAYVQPG